MSDPWTANPTTETMSPPVDCYYSKVKGPDIYVPPVTEQESLAIAKTTARCAQYTCMDALKSFESPRKRRRLLFPKFEKCFCPDRY